MHSRRLLLGINHWLAIRGEHLVWIQVYGVSEEGIAFDASHSISYVKSKLKFHCKVSFIERFTKDALTAFHNENAANLNTLTKTRQF